MYRELFDADHKFAYVSLKEVRERDVQTGEFEADILCLDCEGKFSKWESYAKTVLYGGQLPRGNNIHMENQRNQHGVEFTYIKGIDYTKFKLFLLSVLWRSSISRRPLFKNIALGPYEEKLRSVLLAEDPGPAHAYPCVMSTYRNHKLPVEIVGEPRKITRGGAAYSFLINGVLYYFYITHKSTKDWVLEAAINKAGELRVVHMPERESKKILNSYFGADLFK